MWVPGRNALLVGVAVDRELEQVRPDAAVVEQRVALAGGAVAGDALAPSAHSIRNASSARLRLRDPRREAVVAGERVEAELALTLDELRDAALDGRPASARRCA